MHAALSPARALVSILLITQAACATAGPSTPAPPQPLGSVIVNKGSDTMVNLALAWAEAYTAVHPEVSLSVTGGGSGTGIAALINATVDIANASRQIKSEEIAAAQANGVFPTEFVVARDAIAVIVHPNNPIDQLTLQQVSDVYSGRYQNWIELGGEDRPLVRLSRETNSGTHVYFLEEVLRLGNPDDRTLFASETLLLPSSEGIMAELRYNENAIGYDGLGYITEEVKVLAVGGGPEGPFIFPSAQTVSRGEYLIARDLYVYTAGEPAGTTLEYLQWILGPAGQRIVAELGFVPLGTDG